MVKSYLEHISKLIPHHVCVGLLDFYCSPVLSSLSLSLSLSFSQFLFLFVDIFLLSHWLYFLAFTLSSSLFSWLGHSGLASCIPFLSCSLYQIFIPVIFSPGLTPLLIFVASTDFYRLCVCFSLFV